MAPEGYGLVDVECPDLDTEEQKKKLLGRTILHAWDNATGIALCNAELSATLFAWGECERFVLQERSQRVSVSIPAT